MQGFAPPPPHGVEIESTQGHLGTEGAALRISRRKGSFLRPPHVRDFVKEGYFFVPRYEVWGVKIPLQSPNYTRL